MKTQKTMLPYDQHDKIRAHMPKLEEKMREFMMQIPPAKKGQVVRFKRNNTPELMRRGDERRRAVLSAVVAGCKTYRELSDHTGIPQHSITGYVDRLVGWGFAFRVSGYRTEVGITDDGMGYLDGLNGQR